MRAYGFSCGGVTRCHRAAPSASASKRCLASWGYYNPAESRRSLVRESAVKPVGKPDALIGHVRFDERGWETGRRFGISAHAHTRLYKLDITGQRPHGRKVATREHCSGGTKGHSLLPGRCSGRSNTLEPVAEALDDPCWFISTTAAFRMSCLRGRMTQLGSF
jgi:hypothetical protein